MVIILFIYKFKVGWFYFLFIYLFCKTYPKFLELNLVVFFFNMKNWVEYDKIKDWKDKKEKDRIFIEKK